jgi:hypothetical protein
MASLRLVSLFTVLTIVLLVVPSNPIAHANPQAAPPTPQTQPVGMSVRPAPASPLAPVSFAKAVTYGWGGCESQSVAIGDLNGDGHLDLVVSSFFNSCSGGFGTVGVLLGNGNGTFQNAVTYTVDEFPSFAAIADVNGDGHPDLVVSGLCLQNGGCNGSAGGVSVLLGKGDGTFQSPVTYGVPKGAGEVVVADVNGDGHPDLVVATGCQGGCGAAVNVLLGNGDGTFQAPIGSGTGGAGSLAVGDLNGDGRLDVAVVGTEVSVMQGNGDGTFQAPTVYPTGGDGATWVAMADLNGDGHLDLVVANTCESGTSCQYGSAGVLLGNGDGTFKAPVSYLSDGGEARSVAVQDVNGDGKPDVILANQCHSYSGCAGGGSTGDVGVLLGNGDGTFQNAMSRGSGGYFGWSVAIGDVNGDGKPDLAVVNYGYSSASSVAVLLNNTPRSTTGTTLTSSPNPSVVHQSVNFTAKVTSVKPVPNGATVTFYSGSTKLGTGTTTSGVATFSTSFSAARSYTIKAKYAGDGFHSPSYGTVTQVVNP